MQTITTVKKIKTFSNGAKMDRFATDNGEVLAWDPICGHYTRLHSLTTRQINKILASA